MLPEHRQIIEGLLTEPMRTLLERDFAYAREVFRNQLMDLTSRACRYIATCPLVMVCQDPYIPVLVDLSEQQLPEAGDDRQEPGACRGECFDAFREMLIFDGCAVILYPHEGEKDEVSATAVHETTHEFRDLGNRSEGHNNLPATPFEEAWLTEAAAYGFEESPNDLRWILETVVDNRGSSVSDGEFRGRYISFYYSDSVRNGYSPAMAMDLLQLNNFVRYNNIPQREIAQMAFDSKSIADFFERVNEKYGFNVSQAEPDARFIVEEVKNFACNTDYDFDFATDFLLYAVDYVNARVTDLQEKELCYARLVDTMQYLGSSLFTSDEEQLVVNIEKYNDRLFELREKLESTGSALFMLGLDKLREKLNEIVGYYNQKWLEGILTD